LNASRLREEWCGIATGPTTQYLAYDGHGGTRLLTGSGGSIVSRFNFDAYGNALGQNFGSSNLPSTTYLYSGEQLDPDLGNYYLRARYYDPSNGRFNRVDPFTGDSLDPRSLHKYAYGNNDVVNAVDPSGLASSGTLLELNTTIAAISTLATLVLNAIFSGVAVGNILKDVLHPDGIIVNFGFSVGTYGLVGGISGHLLLDFKTKNSYVFLTSEFGTSPVTAFMGTQKVAMVLTGGVVWNMERPEDLSGYGTVATWPWVLLRAIKNKSKILFRDINWTSWSKEKEALVEIPIFLARYGSSKSLYANRSGVMQLGQSSSGAATWTGGFWSYSFTFTAGHTWGPYDLSQLPANIKDTVADLKNILAGWTSGSWTGEQLTSKIQEAIDYAASK
jgi:RHS repeat-associated protein